MKDIDLCVHVDEAAVLVEGTLLSPCNAKVKRSGPEHNVNFVTRVAQFQQLRLEAHPAGHGVDSADGVVHDVAPRLEGGCEQGRVRDVEDLRLHDEAAQPAFILRHRLSDFIGRDPR